MRFLGLSWDKKPTILKLGIVPLAVANIGSDETPLIVIGLSSGDKLTNRFGFLMTVADAQVSRKKFVSCKGSDIKLACTLH